MGESPGCIGSLSKGRDVPLWTDYRLSASQMPSNFKIYCSFPQVEGLVELQRVLPGQSPTKMVSVGAPTTSARGAVAGGRGGRGDGARAGVVAVIAVVTFGRVKEAFVKDCKGAHRISSRSTGHAQ